MVGNYQINVPINEDYTLITEESGDIYQGLKKMEQAQLGHILYHPESQAEPKMTANEFSQLAPSRLMSSKLLPEAYCFYI